MDITVIKYVVENFKTIQYFKAVKYYETIKSVVEDFLAIEVVETIGYFQAIEVVETIEYFQVIKLFPFLVLVTLNLRIEIF
jgi:hypothetical protein